MRAIAIAALICLMASITYAGGNPNVKGYIDFDPPNMVHEAMPVPFTTVNAYICFTDLDMGLTSASFMVTDVATVCPGVFAPPSFVNLLPGDLAIGNVFTGITVASTGCEDPPTVCVGYISLFYLGGECCLELLDHPDYPRWVTDCNDPAEVDFYCVLSHGSIGGATCPPGDCPSGVPDVVVCEPQGGANPTHPPTYWYDVTPGSADLHDFHVEVYDPNFANYTNIVAPSGWTWLPYILNAGGKLWFCWCDPELDDPLPVGTTFRFQFDHPGFSDWASWVTTNDGMCDPLTGIVDSSDEHMDEEPGYGYLVHSPLPYSAVEPSSWGNIKSLYR
jgi:hypothetical protein